MSKVWFISVRAEVSASSSRRLPCTAATRSGPHFQKVTQVIPVRITIDDTKGLALAPGMNVTARIHRP
jgi:multidrug resistance efflux pump